MMEPRLAESDDCAKLISLSCTNGDPDDLYISANDSNSNSSGEFAKAESAESAENQQAELGAYVMESRFGSGLLTQDAVFDSAEDDIRNDVENQN